jgi:hypothetical protein
MLLDHLPQDNPPPVDSIARWLRLRGLGLPAWILVECIRPFGWILGQFSLVAYPLARGLGVDRQLEATRGILESPDALSALSKALAPEGEAR